MVKNNLDVEKVLWRASFKIQQTELTVRGFVQVLVEFANRQ